MVLPFFPAVFKFLHVCITHGCGLHHKVWLPHKYAVKTSPSASLGGAPREKERALIESGLGDESYKQGVGILGEASRSQHRKWRNYYPHVFYSQHRKMGKIFFSNKQSLTWIWEIWNIVSLSWSATWKYSSGRVRYNCTQQYILPLPFHETRRNHNSKRNRITSKSNIIKSFPQTQHLQYNIEVSQNDNWQACHFGVLSNEMNKQESESLYCFQIQQKDNWFHYTTNWSSFT